MCRLTEKPSKPKRAFDEVMDNENEGFKNEPKPKPNCNKRLRIKKSFSHDFLAYLLEYECNTLTQLLENETNFLTCLLENELQTYVKVVTSTEWPI